MERLEDYIAFGFRILISMKGQTHLIQVSAITF